MKNTVKLFLLTIILLSAYRFTNSYSQDYSIAGTWERNSTDDDLAGARVEVTTTDNITFTGKITIVTQEMKAYCYETGDVKWFNVTKKPNGLYEMDDLTKSRNCSPSRSSKSIRFTDENTINITALSIEPNTGENFQVWTRVIEGVK